MRSFGGSVLFLSLLPLLSIQAQNPAATVNVDVNAGRRAINPNIYGIAYGTTAQLSDLNVPINRYGGNNTSRYNWQVNGDNRGQDWYFESLADTSSVAGERGDTFIASSRAGGAQALITVPMIGWVAKVGAGRGKLASFSIGKYGAQTGNDWQWFSDAGNGILSSNGQFVVGNDPNDANVPNTSTLQQQWVQAMVNKWGLAANGGQPYYILDNEHSIWHSTHRDVHPTGAGMDEIRSRILDYASAIKAIDPQAKVLGPEEWGWSGYLLSGSDQQYGSLHGWSFMPDRAAHNNMDYLPWLLSQLKLDGRHLIDVFTVHYYPQSGEFGNDTSTNMQLTRNKSTRSLWDPNYVDASWIADKVMLIPRLRNWVNTYYDAGTPIGITEYNWGAESHINGATTQADIFGIFGREGLDMGARWTTPDASTPTYKAMKIYRNYDGNKSTFGDTSVSAAGPNPDNVSVFGAQRTSDGALTVMVIAKYLSGTTPVTINLANFSGTGVAQKYQLTSANAITHLADQNYSGSSLTFTAPAQSITLLVLPKSGTTNQPPTAHAAATPNSGTAPLPVAFSSAGSTDPDGSIVSYGWIFGDGGTGTGASVNHTYASAGTFTAVLTVTDNLGATATAPVTVTVTAPANQPPTAHASATPTSGTAPLPVAFNAAGSADPDGSILSYGWTFGDGGTGTGASVNHTYASAGTYTATLKVTDNLGATATAPVTVTVSAAPPPPPAAPSGLSGSASRGTVTLKWTDNSSNETGFYIERAPSGTTSFARIGTVGANVKTFSESPARATFLYRVQAYNANGVSAYSNTVSVRVK